jgi:hypothetical protein
VAPTALEQRRLNRKMDVPDSQPVRVWRSVSDQVGTATDLRWIG